MSPPLLVLTVSSWYIFPNPNPGSGTVGPLWEGTLVVVWGSEASASETESAGKVFVISACAGLSTTGLCSPDTCVVPSAATLTIEPSAVGLGGDSIKVRSPGIFTAYVLLSSQSNIVLLACGLFSLLDSGGCWANGPIVLIGVLAGNLFVVSKLGSSLCVGVNDFGVVELVSVLYLSTTLFTSSTNLSTY